MICGFWSKTSNLIIIIIIIIIFIEGAQLAKAVFSGALCQGFSSCPYNLAPRFSLLRGCCPIYWEACPLYGQASVRLLKCF